jgi:hypothetical protein
MTSLRVVALLQSLLSSRQRMMYSFCSILVRTMASTWRALFCSVELRLPGAAEMRPVRGQVAVEARAVRVIGSQPGRRPKPSGQQQSPARQATVQTDDHTH